MNRRAPNRAGQPSRNSLMYAGAGLLGGLGLSGVFGGASGAIGGIGTLFELLPLIVLGGGALYAVQVFKK